MSIERNAVDRKASNKEANDLARLLSKNGSKVLQHWTSSLAAAHGPHRRGVSEAEMARHTEELLAAMSAALEWDDSAEIEAAAWDRTRGILSEISREQSARGATPTEIAVFVFSLKEPLFDMLRTEFEREPERLAREVWSVSTLLDRLGLFTTDVALKARQEIILRQQKEMMELSTPVVKLWEGILALPLIGTLDSERTQIVMENLLDEIVRSGAGIAVIDITGVPTVDTLVAQHLLKTVAAARLMGAECIISGIRPQIAATIVHLGVDLGGVTTKATLADAFTMALQKNGLTVVKVSSLRKVAE